MPKPIPFKDAGGHPATLEILPTHEDVAAKATAAGQKASKLDGFANMDDNKCYVVSDTDLENFVETIIHEVAHIYFPGATEQRINRYGKAVMKVLLKTVEFAGRREVK